MTARSIAPIRTAVVAALVAATACASAGKRLEQGLDAEARGDWFEAAERYADALEKEPTLEDARRGLYEAGDSAVRLGMRRSAELLETDDPVGAAEATAQGGRAPGPWARGGRDDPDARRVGPAPARGLRRGRGAAPRARRFAPRPGTVERRPRRVPEDPLRLRTHTRPGAGEPRRRGRSPGRSGRAPRRTTRATAPRTSAPPRRWRSPDPSPATSSTRPPTSRSARCRAGSASWRSSR